MRKEDLSKKGVILCVEKVQTSTAIQLYDDGADSGRGESQGSFRQKVICACGRRKVALGKHHRSSASTFPIPHHNLFPHISSQCLVSGTLPARPRALPPVFPQKRSVPSRPCSDRLLRFQHGHSRHRASQLPSTSQQSADRNQTVRAHAHSSESWLTRI